MQATQTIPAASAPLQFPKARHATGTVTQAELVELIEFQNLRTQLEEKIAGIEASMKARLESGIAVESGVHVASLKESFRRNVGWKDVVIRLAARLGLDGDAYCSNVLAHTRPTRTVTVDVH